MSGTIKSKGGRIRLKKATQGWADGQYDKYGSSIITPADQPEVEPVVDVVCWECGEKFSGYGWYDDGSLFICVECANRLKRIRRLAIESTKRGE